MSEKSLAAWIMCVIYCVTVAIVSRVRYPELTEMQLFLTTWWAYAIGIGASALQIWIARRNEN